MIVTNLNFQLVEFEYLPSLSFYIQEWKLSLLEKKNFMNLSPRMTRPQNFVRDPNVGPRVKQWKKKRIGACSLTCSISGVGGHVKTSNELAQERVQDETNLHNQEKGAVSAN